MIGLRRGLGAGIRPIFAMSHLSQIWQDAGKTTPGAVNSPIGNIASSYGGFEMTQTNAASKPTLSDGLSFDGGDTLFMNTPSEVNWGTGPFTAEVWMYAAASAGAMIALSANPATYAGFQIYNHALYMANVAGTAFTISGMSIGTFTANTWTHIAACRDASGILRTYKNGAFVAQATYTDALYHSTANLFNLGSNRGGYFWTGKLTDFRIYVGQCLYPNGSTFTPPARSGS